MDRKWQKFTVEFSQNGVSFDNKIARKHSTFVGCDKNQTAYEKAVELRKAIEELLTSVKEGNDDNSEIHR